ncbi:hypothetical protein D3C87_82550 [compost metagenome]
MADSRYGEASLRSREYLSSKVKKELNKNITDYALRFVKLTSLIPNWETYLTSKQLESATRYLKCYNATDVDHQLKLTYGTTHQRLFGGSSSKGALGRLEEIYQMLERGGFFKDKEKKEAIAEKEKTPKLTSQTLLKMRELIKIVVETNNYDQYLTPSQNEKVKEFLARRSFPKAAEALNITVQSYQQALIGSGGILDILKKAIEKKSVNSWEEI